MALKTLFARKVIHLKREKNIKKEVDSSGERYSAASFGTKKAELERRGGMPEYKYKRILTGQLDTTWLRPAREPNSIKERKGFMSFLDKDVLIKKEKM